MSINKYTNFREDAGAVNIPNFNPPLVRLGKGEVGRQFLYS